MLDLVRQYEVRKPYTMFDASHSLRFISEWSEHSQLVTTFWIGLFYYLDRSLVAAQCCYKVIWKIVMQNCYCSSIIFDEALSIIIINFELCPNLTKSLSFISRPVSSTHCCRLMTWVKNAIKKSKNKRVNLVKIYIVHAYKILLSQTDKVSHERDNLQYIIFKINKIKFKI